MRNLEQIRSFNALAVAGKKYSGKDEGDIVKKIPAMIHQNGFLGALAYAIEDEKRAKKNNSDKESGYALVFEAIVAHLQSPGIELYPGDSTSLVVFAQWLSAEDQDCIVLRTITTEAIAFMNILRRYA